MLSFMVNQRWVRTDQPPGMLLLEFIRDVSCLCGTKEACREGECGACTVLIGQRLDHGRISYKACASCLIPIGDVEGCHVVTVEGLLGTPLTLVQQLIIEHSASQCGFCTPGIVLSLTGFGLCSPTLSYEDALDALDGNICRCTGYVAIRNAARALSQKLDGLNDDRVPALVAAAVLPPYFLEIPAQLAQAQREPTPFAENLVLVAGGTDLFVQKPEALFDAQLCFLSHRRDLDYLRQDGEVLRIGGAVTLEDFRRNPLIIRHFPSLTQDILLHSSTILRNKATLTGNIVNASPIGDATIILLALDARLVLTAQDGSTRELPLDQFFLAYKKTALAPGELISEIILPLLTEGASYHFEKVSNRVTLDIAAVNTAIKLQRDAQNRLIELRISAGGVGPIPFMVAGLEAFLGQTLDAGLVEQIAQVAHSAAKPIDDIRGSAAYKKLLFVQLVRAHFAAFLGSEVKA